MTEQRLFKFLTPQRTGGYSGYRWPEIGVWTPRIPEAKGLSLCERGYHILAADQLVGDYMHEELYEVGWAGNILRDGEKCAARQAKLIQKIETWNARTQRIFAADCAERVLPIYEKQFPNEKRVRACIQAARDFADGKITDKELAAARDACAAACAAGDAAWAAAWDAEQKWQREHLKEMLGIYEEAEQQRSA